MRKPVTTTLFFLTLCMSCSALAQPETSANLEHAKQLFKQCIMCHGQHGEKKAMGRSDAINTWDTEKLVQSLQDHKDNKIIGPGNIVKKRLSSEEMRDIAEYIQTLK